MTLAAKSQALVAIEPLEGSSEVANLVAADLVEVLADTFPVVSPTNESIQRRPAKNSLSKLMPIPGGREGTFTAQIEMAGPVVASGSTWDNTMPSGFSSLLRACGMRMLRGVRVRLTSIDNSGVVYHGETGTFNTTNPAGGTWTVYGDVHANATTGVEDFYVHLHNDIFNDGANWQSSTGLLVSTDLLFETAAGDDITIPDPTGTHTDSRGQTVNNQVPCLIYHPYDDEISHLHWTPDGTPSGTSPFSVGEIITGATSGAKASVVGGRLNSLTATTRDAPLFVRMLTGSAAFSAGETVTGDQGGDLGNGTLTDTVPATVNADHFTGQPVFQEDIPSLTIQTRHNGPALAIKGARGNWTLDVNNRDRPMFTFELRGAGVAPSDDDNVAFGSGITNEIPPVVVGSNLTFDGTFSPLYGTMTYQGNNTLTLRDAPSDSSASGYLSTRIVDRAPSISVEAEAVRAAIFDAWSAHRSKSQVRATQKFESTTAGNSFEIRARGIAIDELDPSDKEGILGQQMTLSMNTSASALRGELFNDECIIVQY